MKRSNVKKILIVILIIVFLPIVILFLLVKLIISYFTKEKSDLEKNIDVYINRVKKEFIREPSLYDNIIDDKITKTINAHEAEKILLENAIDVLLKERYKLTLDMYDLKRLKKKIIKNINKDYTVKNLTVHKIKELLVFNMDLELLSSEEKNEELYEKELVYEKPFIKENGVGNILEAKEFNEKEIVNEKPEKIEDNILVKEYTKENTKKDLIKILSSHQEIEKEVVLKINETTLEEIIDLGAVNLALETIKIMEEKNDEVVVEFAKNDLAKEMEVEIEKANEDIKVGKPKKLEEVNKKEKIEQQKIIEEINYNHINTHEIDNMLMFLYQKESIKEEIEDRNYDIVHEHIDVEILRIEKLLLTENIDKESLDKLNNYKNKLYNIKDNTDDKKEKDYDEFKLELNKDISKDDERIHHDLMNDVDKKNLELLDSLNIKSVQEINDFEKEKYLIYKQLDKIENSNNIFKRITNFFKSKIFKSYSDNKVIKKELVFLDNIISKDNKAVENIYPVKHKDILEDDKVVCENNVLAINEISKKIDNKYPHMKKDLQYKNKMNSVTNILDKKKEKIVKKNKFKEKVLEKRTLQKVRKKIETR